MLILPTTYYNCSVMIDFTNVIDVVGNKIILTTLTTESGYLIDNQLLFVVGIYFVVSSSCFKQNLKCLVKALK